MFELILPVRRWWVVGLLAGISLFPLAARAQIPAPPEISARAYLLLDVTSNQVLAARNLDMAFEPASLTKLMTAYLVFDALKNKKIALDQAFPVSERAWKMPGARMFIDTKVPVRAEDLIKGMVVQSGNDATVALAEAVGGSVDHFVQMMNQQAKALGMKNTVYKNPEGLSASGHTTTARDQSILAARLVRDFPLYIAYYAIQHYRYPDTPKSNDTNRNSLLFRDPSVDGLITGYTDTAGYGMVATAKRDFPALGQGEAGQRRLLSVLMGASSENMRAAESQKLLNWGYTAYEAVRLFPAGQPVATPAIWKGKESRVKLGRPEGVVVTVPSGEGSKLKTDVLRADPLVAPFQKGQTVGSLRVSTATGNVVAEVPLQVLESVDEAGLFGRAWDAMRLWIK